MINSVDARPAKTKHELTDMFNQSLRISLSVLTAIFQVNLGYPVFIKAKDDGGGGDNWSYNSCKAPVKSSPPTNQHPVLSQARCPSCRPTNSVKALNGKI